MIAPVLSVVASAGPLALLLLMGVAFAETALLVGFLLPADTVLVSAGLLVAAGTLHLPVWLSLVGLALAATAGGQLAYLVGRRMGRHRGPGRESRAVSSRRLAAARSFFDRHGSKAVVLSRFVPLARTLAPVLAGAVGMDPRRFLLHNAIGAAAWAACMFGGGYWLGDIPGMSSHLSLVLLGIAAVSVLPSLTSFLRHRTAPTSMA